ncbi:uncharacterized protein EKO05_0009688 [Ascochyta rabiei]|uniref:uncharacterized protein n=1 Tax=Didymella rabiei TaxID=5454 RepID=UPI0021FEFA08|nr:uncharacterized protein EKO05_0009688 [Ascochyta rabiei]UPX19425.1 hypothetical protein EKO05_0009688 [Ascochyta rabiei]
MSEREVPGVVQVLRDAATELSRGPQQPYRTSEAQWTSSPLQHVHIPVLDRASPLLSFPPEPPFTFHPSFPSPARTVSTLTHVHCTSLVASSSDAHIQRAALPVTRLPAGLRLGAVTAAQGLLQPAASDGRSSDQERDQAGRVCEEGGGGAVSMHAKSRVKCLADEGGGGKDTI